MSKRRERTKRWLILACMGMVWAGGCFTERRPAKPTVNFVTVVRPVLPVMAETALALPPDVEMEPQEGPPQIGPGYVPPPKPRVVVHTAQEPQETEKHVETLMAPELTAEETIAAKAEAQRGLEMAEKNLALTQGKKLNAMQLDLVSKVRDFSENAREAMKTGDWVRAKSLSKKAQVLSEELAASL